MLRRLLPLVLALSFCPAAAAQQLDVWFIDVGQGDSTLLRSPTGVTFLFDAGDNGDGSADVVPLLQSLGLTDVSYVGASHYHADHIGGLDEVWNAGFRATFAYDRGPGNPPGTQSYTDYANTYGSTRRTVTPGQVLDLGGGVTLTCLVVEGRLSNGQTVNISGSSQWENSASIAWLVRYGDFEMFMAGDLTGGGNGTTDVESAVAPLAGDVDVLKVSHHGSLTSTNQAFVNALQPEFALFPCGFQNVYGYPKQEIVNRLSTPARAIPLWCTTEGVGTEGFVDAGGNVHLSTDGSTYTISAEDGTSFTCHVDEQPPAAPGAGELVVAEFLRDPARVSDNEGEYVELAGARVSAGVSLSSVQVSDLGADSFTIGSGILLQAGGEACLGADGLSSRNGGFRPVLVWPAGTFSLSSPGDTVRLRRGGVTLDQVDYTSAWPGVSARSAERKDLLGAAASSNFADAVSAFGLGDLGTPGESNDADITNFGGGGGDPYVEVITPPVRGDVLEMNWHAPGEANYLYQGFCTLGTAPGFDLGGAHIPGNQDQAYSLTSGLPGWFGQMPPAEVVYVNAGVPLNPRYAGLQIYALFYTYEYVPGQGLTVRAIADPVAMVIQ
ncbi:MAG: MBL fold metallo-hydrolase [Planctomycetota bacterium]|nr:MAG: MBL fold metallo-hydrolase [Planctomycetota bacterium]